MKAKLTLNGKEYEVELTESQVSEIEGANKPKTGFEYGGLGMEWYVSDSLTDSEPIFSNEGLCKGYARAVNLFLKLSQWQAFNDEKVRAYQISRFIITFDDRRLKPVPKHNSQRNLLTVEFSSLEKARQAINEFCNELTWYFTEFKPRLDL